MEAARTTVDAPRRWTSLAAAYAADHEAVELGMTGRFYDGDMQVPAAERGRQLAVRDVLGCSAVIMCPGRATWADGLLDVESGLLWESPAGDERDDARVLAFAAAYNAVIGQARPSGVLGCRDYSRRVETTSSVLDAMLRATCVPLPGVGGSIDAERSSPFIVSVSASVGDGDLLDVISTDRRTMRRITVPGGVSTKFPSTAFFLHGGLTLGLLRPTDIRTLDLVDGAWLQCFGLPAPSG